MATFSEIYAMSIDQNLQYRIRAIMIKSALSISGEPIAAMTAIQTLKRQQMAHQILNGGGNMNAWSLAVCNNPTVAAAGLNVVDGDLEFTVNSVWDDMSGVTTEDIT